MEVSRTHTFQATESDRRQRVDGFLARQLPHLSRTRIGILARRGCLEIGGIVAKPGHQLRPGEVIRFREPLTPAPPEMAAEEIPLEILYEDSDLLVLDKPAGLVVHPGAGHSRGTLTAALLHHCGHLSSIGGVERPGIVHRLDKETSGVMVVAKNDVTHRDLAEQFSDRRVEKVYFAVVRGRPSWTETDLEAPIRRHPIDRKRMSVTVAPLGRPAGTAFTVRESNGRYSLVECRPRTGRTHQIRIHLKHLGHPVAGDPLYGKREAFDRHLLHARFLAFDHPAKRRRVEFEAPLPEGFHNLASSPAGDA